MIRLFYRTGFAVLFLAVVQYLFFGQKISLGAVSFWWQYSIGFLWLRPLVAWQTISRVLGYFDVGKKGKKSVLGAASQQKNTNTRLTGTLVATIQAVLIS